MADIVRLEYIAAELRGKAGSFRGAADTLRQQATRLDWMAQDLTNGVSAWAGRGSYAFKNAWNRYHQDTHNAASALDNTALSLARLAQRIEEQVQTIRSARERQTEVLLAAGGLALLSAFQLGADPVTDAATAGALEISFAAEAEITAAEESILIYDLEVGSELEGITGTIADSSDLIDIVGGDLGIQKIFTPPDTTLGISSDGPGVTYEYSGSVWSRSWEQKPGEILGAPVTNTETIGLDNGNIGISADATGIMAEGGLSVFKASDDALLGSKSLGLTSSLEGEALGVDGSAGFKDGTLGADIGVTGVSATGSAGINIDGVNASVNGTIGLKAELGFKIGAETEIKLPFFSFGFSLGSAN